MPYHPKLTLTVGSPESRTTSLDLETTFRNNDLTKHIKVVLTAYIASGTYLFKVKNYKEYGILGAQDMQRMFNFVQLIRK